MESPELRCQADLRRVSKKRHLTNVPSAGALCPAKGASMSTTKTIAVRASLFLIAFCWGSLFLSAQTERSTGRVAATEISPPEIKNLFWQPNQLQQGSPVFFTVELSRVPARVTGTWIDRTLTFFKSQSDPKIWYALGGADFAAQPGSHPVKVVAVLPNGKRLAIEKPAEIVAKDFKTGSIEVPEKYVEPNAAEQRQIARDEVFKKRAYAHLIQKPLWSGDFIKPVKGESVENFGESRVLNEEEQSTHRGTDFEAKEGTPVLASNSGVVVLAKEMFYEGNCVIIDHGGRFYTTYMHLSKIDVKAGHKIKKGAQIGLSGDTGRVTGPHLHMGVLWNGAYLDPVQVVALTLPNLDERSSDNKSRHGRD
jgi:murein DD-endopeptidase MepM/ murein hydrolase activator NlpD